MVTGGANGIGESIVRAFLRHGAKVCVADIDDDAGHHLVEGLVLNGFDDVTYCHCDVTIEEDVKLAIDLAVDKYGTLDIMVNNAGVTGLPTPDIRHANVSDLGRVLDVNVKGVLAGMKHAARVMVPKGRGSIVSTCSIAGVMGGAGPHAYTASKHAVLGLTRSAAGDLGRHGVRVNCVSPYGIITRMVLSAGHRDESDDVEEITAAWKHIITSNANLKSVELTTDDVADAVVYLASDEARYVSGANLMIDGGFSSYTNAFRHMNL